VIPTVRGARKARGERLTNGLAKRTLLFIGAPCRDAHLGGDLSALFERREYARGRALCVTSELVAASNSRGMLPLATAHRAVVALIAVGVLVEFFFAGAGAFGATSYDVHMTVGKILLGLAGLAVLCSTLA
jgi:hypothetical protein